MVYNKIMKKLKTLLIRGGEVVLGQTVSQLDIFVEGEKITAVGNLSHIRPDNTIDAEGLYVLPGAIDPHVHFNEHNKGHSGVHDYYTGSRAAAFGGTTSIIDFSDQLHNQPLIKTLKVKKEQAKGNCLIDWNMHPIISDVTPRVLKEIPEIIKEGVPTFKCFMTFRSMTGESAVNMYSGKPGRFITDKDFTKLTQCLHKNGGMLMVHAEDSKIIDKNAMNMKKAGKTRAIDHALCRTPESEAMAVNRIINVIKKTNGRIYIVHLSSQSGLQMVSAARSEGYDVFAETCPHFLIFTDEVLRREDGYKWLGSPPIRDKQTQEKLWDGLIDGRISTIATDDCAFSLSSKMAGAEDFDKCPEGMPGIEPRLTILFSEGVAKGRLPLPRLVEITSSIPALLFGLAPRKGSLFPGSDADIVLFDPSTRWTMNRDTLHMASDYSAYDNIEVTGKVVKVFSRGELIIDGNECLAERGRGKFVKCKLDNSIRATV